MPEKRNIVLITLDSLRADHCSFMGYERETTPTIDKMAKEGLYFENAIAPSVGTPASMICTFTGSHSPVDPMETRPEPWRRVLSRRKTLAQVLSENDYYTGAIHPNPFVSRYFGFDKGFDYFQDFLSEEKGFFSRVYRKIFKKTTESGKTGIASTLRNIRNLLQREELFRPWESYHDHIMNWIRKANEPFFLWILLLDTHYPFLAPRKFRKWGNFFGMQYYNWKMQKGNFTSNFSEKGRQNLINAYDDSIRHADSFVNQLWNDLKEKDPIFIIHSDHGEGFGEHGFYGHQSFLYEEIIHIPLVIYNADIKGKIQSLVSLLQLSPTILDLLNIRNVFSGKSFLNNENDWVVSEVTEKERKKVAVRMRDWKFITGQRDTDELYSIKGDSNEKVNLINEHPKLAEELKKIVRQHLVSNDKSSLIYSDLRRKLQSQ